MKVRICRCRPPAARRCARNPPRDRRPSVRSREWSLPAAWRAARATGQQWSPSPRGPCSPRRERERPQESSRALPPKSPARSPISPEATVVEGRLPRTRQGYYNLCATREQRYRTRGATRIRDTNAEMPNGGRLALRRPIAAPAAGAVHGIRSGR